MKVVVGVFAYNEADNVAKLLRQLAEQTLLSDGEVEIEVHILANGCTDATVALASEAVQLLPAMIADRFHVHDLPFKGKSRTWNHFVRVLSPADTEIFVFMDADIELVEADTLNRMLGLLATPGCMVVNSRPVKDIEISGESLGAIERLILKSGGGLTNYKRSICGQLYMVRGEVVRRIYLPVGLPVEDGFLRAMILTDLLTVEEDLKRITGSEGVFHVYESIRTIGELIRHQTRITIGTAINEALFRYLRRVPGDMQARERILRDAAEKEDWLAEVIRQELPRWPYGYVSFKLLTKRLRSMPQERWDKRLRRLPVLVIGLCFDSAVFIISSIKMWAGRGAGYW